MIYNYYMEDFFNPKKKLFYIYMVKNGCDSCDSCDTSLKSFYNDGFQVGICHNCRFFELWQLWHLMIIKEIGVS